MAYSDELKAEVRAWYESHFDEAKDVAKQFKVNERTMRYWVLNESWERGKFVKGGKLKELKKELTSQAISETIQNARGHLAEEIKNQMAQDASRGLLAGVIQEGLAEKIADDLIFQAMTMEFMDSEILKAGLVAKAVFQTQIIAKPNDPRNMSMASSYATLWMEIKKSMHGKEPQNIININNVNSLNKSEVENMSDEQLLQFIAKAEKENGKNG